MKTQNTNKLNFRKGTIAELNELDLNDINGGGTPLAGTLIYTSVVVALTYFVEVTN